MTIPAVRKRAEPRKVALSILIVSYNTREMTLAAIRSVYEQAADTGFEVIVVDNASGDGSADAIAAEFPQVQLIRSKENLGFGRANNVAAAEARGDLLLLLNPDTIILDHAIDKLAQFARVNPAGKMWVGRTVLPDGSVGRTSCRRFISLWSITADLLWLSNVFSNSQFFNPRAYGGWDRSDVREVEVGSGCFFLVDRTLWKELGGFDETFFMFAEEADLCYRARGMGARLLFTPDATIIHYGGASERLRSARAIARMTGQVHYLRKHWSRPKAALAIGLLKLHVFSRMLAYKLLGSLARNQKYRSAAEEWRAIWAVRSSWSAGYPRIGR